MKIKFYNVKSMSYIQNVYVNGNNRLIDDVTANWYPYEGGEL